MVMLLYPFFIFVGLGVGDIDISCPWFKSKRGSF